VLDIEATPMVTIKMASISQIFVWRQVWKGTQLQLNSTVVSILPPLVWKDLWNKRIVFNWLVIILVSHWVLLIRHLNALWLYILKNITWNFECID
jgi:hypothetical protein